MITSEGAMLLSVAALMPMIGEPDVVVLDASMQASGGDFIPGARSFDFDRRICDFNNPLPHMMPAPALFEAEARALGVNRCSRVVVYDRKGIYASARARWMFKAMGHDDVTVLDGGLPAWEDDGLVVATASSVATLGDFVVEPRPHLFCDAQHVQLSLTDPFSCVLDARPAGRFHGRDPEPRAGLLGGHMPGARNLPFTEVLKGTCMKSANELRAIEWAAAHRDDLSADWERARSKQPLLPIPPLA